MGFYSELIKSPVIVSTGIGGVGKTTMSVALAISLAQELNARVLVVTIDPAKRLADVMSQDHIGHKPEFVDHSKFVGAKVKGQVFASMVEMQKGWEEIIDRYAKTSEDAQRIYQNKLFKNLTTRFSHSLDFVAMDQLYMHYRSGDYDYIVLDTPPTSKAFGFFDAPQALSEFFGGKLVRLLSAPYRAGRGRAAKLLDFASQPFLSLADKVLGKEFLNDIGEFFFLFHTMYDDFAQRADDITEFLCSEKVNNVLITKPSQFVSRDDLEIIDGLKQRKLETKLQIINGLGFEENDIKEVEEFVNGNDSAFAQYLSQDLTVQKAVKAELAKRKSSNTAASTSISPIITTISRKLTLDEIGRLKAVIEDIQSLNKTDDTV